jgi:hopanoid biosynthesis associated protein HpnK
MARCGPRRRRGEARAARVGSLNRLVVTADDFGLASEVNEAVEAAHRSGILSTASLMVAAPSAPDAVRRARGMPNLRVGLHVVLVDGRAALPPEQVPHLADDTGRLPEAMVPLSFRMVLDGRARRALAREIRAQFEAFRRTGLPLDHVNVHKHFHLHPMVAGMILRIGRELGMRALRVPVEPLPPGWKGGLAQSASAAAMRRWAALIRARARAQGLLVPDAVYGLAWSGAMTEDRLLAVLHALPEGLVEIYGHPATANRFPGSARGYDYAGELAALCSVQAIEAVRASGRGLGGFTDGLREA